MRLTLRVLMILLTVLMALTACSGGAVPVAPTEAAPEPPATVGPTPTHMPPEEPATPVPDQAAFSYALPESQGLSSEALEQLVDVVRGYVEDDKIVGAELAVLKNRQIVLHEAVGWKDRDDEIPMVPNTLFNIRSMTKPVIGTAVQMLIDEGKLALSEKVAEHLPAFDNEKSGEITIEHLLTHRSGLPLTLLTKWPDYESLLEIAEEAGEHGPDFEPGTDFSYSDTGSDSLGAVLEVASGVTVDAFVQQRILDPLDMTDTLALVDSEDPRTARVCSAYFDSGGGWSPYWQPGDDPLYPFAMGSQSLYCTPVDYARFLALWMDAGVVGDERLLSAEAVGRALMPVSSYDSPTSFPGLEMYYGQMWILYMETDAADGAEPVLFGHSGSDGTWAWAWPNLDLIVLYFTQSRGQGTGIALEADIDRLLIHPGAEEKVEEVPEEYEPYLGVYTATSGPLRGKEFTVLVQNGHLAINLPQEIVVELKEPDEEGKWYFATVDESIAISFDWNLASDVVAMKIHQAGETYEVPKGAAAPEPELDLEAVQKYLGCYSTEEPDIMVEVIIHNGHLALDITGQVIKLELFPPDEEGKWAIRLNPVVSIGFDEREDGTVESFTSYLPDGSTELRPRVEDEECK